MSLRFVFISRGNPGDLDPLPTAACRLRAQGPAVAPILSTPAHMMDAPCQGQQA